MDSHNDNINDFLNLNFTSLRGMIQAQENNILLQIQRLREVNELQHDNILLKIETLDERVNKFEKKENETREKVDELTGDKAMVKGAWIFLIAAASMLGPIITLFIEHTFFH